MVAPALERRVGEFQHPHQADRAERDWARTHKSVAGAERNRHDDDERNRGDLVSSGVAPKQFVRGEWFVTIAALTGLIWILLNSWGLDAWNGWAAYLLAFAIGFSLRLLALYRAWEEPLAKEPQGVYIHSDGRPMLGRKLAGKSQRELRDLGLVPEGPEAAS